MKRAIKHPRQDALREQIHQHERDYPHFSFLVCRFCDLIEQAIRQRDGTTPVPPKGK